MVVGTVVVPVVGVGVGVGVAVGFSWLEEAIVGTAFPETPPSVDVPVVVIGTTVACAKSSVSGKNTVPLIIGTGRTNVLPSPVRGPKTGRGGGKGRNTG